MSSDGMGKGLKYHKKAKTQQNFLLYLDLYVTEHVFAYQTIFGFVFLKQKCDIDL